MNSTSVYPFIFFVVFQLATLFPLKSAEPFPGINEALEKGSQKVKIVCFGDSVTGLYYHTGGERTYTDMLGIALKQIHPKASVEMINAGISGHTTANGLGRIDPHVLAHKPDLVTVMFGLNDVAKDSIEKYRANLIEIVDRCRAAGSKVILCTPNAVITTPARPVEKLEAYCEVLREVARSKNVVLCDSYNGFVEMRKADPLKWRLTLSDEIHPNMAGHKVIAEQIAETITGERTSLQKVGPPDSPLSKTGALLVKGGGGRVSIVAMPPFDGLVIPAMKRDQAKVNVSVSQWPVEGLSLEQLRKDASGRIRKMKPNLVLIAIPRSAKAVDQEKFIYTQYWIANFSLSFGKKEWDTVVIHPSVMKPAIPKGEEKNDELIRTLTGAHDMHLIDRKPGDDRNGEEIFNEWMQIHLAKKD